MLWSWLSVCAALLGLGSALIGHGGDETQLQRAAAVICPDQESECPDDTTCCELPDSSWGCCPLAKAVCCDDRRHCCPEGTKCDLTHSRCSLSSSSSSSSSSSFSPLLEKIPARRRTRQQPTDPPGSERKKILQDVVCPDQKSACPDETTCCLITNTTYGCCPMPNAVCCSDHVHCCPSGTSCDLQHSTCVASAAPVGSSIKLLPLTTATKLLPPTTTELVESQIKGGAVRCNDSVACADGNTCCESAEGEWACCPLDKAVCCKDRLHCCPHGTVCNLKASTCDSIVPQTSPLLVNEPNADLQADNSKCDKSTSCPGKTTCCKTLTGDWACCPLPQAVCCDDHVHCCPHGTVCNVEAQTCDDPSAALPSVRWLEKISALKRELPQTFSPSVLEKTSAEMTGLWDEKCDKQTMCPAGTTCCKKDSGQWTCCPLPQAVCCSDHQHCCPSGYRCNVAQQTCEKPDGFALPWLNKIAALRKGEVEEKEEKRGNMCDSRTSCPTDATCCLMDQRHTWGCCPLPNAVCCPDGRRCCPAGRSCDAATGGCVRPPLVSWESLLRDKKNTKNSEN